MKKYLLGTTALVAAGMLVSAGDAAAQAKTQPVQVSVGGYHGQFLGYVSQDDRAGASATGKPAKTDVQSDSEIHFNGRTTLDNGITVGFRVELEGNSSSDQIDESYMFVESKFGRLEIGSLNNVAYRMHYKAPDVFTRGWLNEGNVQNFVVNTTRSPIFDSTLGVTAPRFFDNDSEKVNYYTPRFEGFQFGLTYVPEASQDRNGAVPQKDVGLTAGATYQNGFAVAGNFVRSFSGFDVAASAGYFRWQAPDNTGGVKADNPTLWNTGLNLGYAGFKVGASYGKITKGRVAGAGTFGAAPSFANAARLEGRAFDVGASYTFGPAAVALTYFNGDNDSSPTTGGTASSSGKDKFTALALTGNYKLGPGVNWDAALWTSKFQGNNSTTNLDDNKASGFVTGLVLVF
ncbi:MAG: porin [Rhodospirillales bacterium]|nr:porin [Rhodospirillales bacterium]